MNTPSLLPEDAGVLLSPRLRWAKKHQVRTHFASHMEGPEDLPWCAWLPDNDHPEHACLPLDPENCGYGRDAETAMGSLCLVAAIPHWLQEDGA